jgi:hypothetical protein
VTVDHRCHRSTNHRSTGSQYHRPPVSPVHWPPVHWYTVKQCTGRTVLQYDSRELCRTPSRLPTVLSETHLGLFKRAIWNFSWSTRSTTGDPVMAIYGRHLASLLGSQTISPNNPKEISGHYPDVAVYEFQVSA